MAHPIAPPAAHPSLEIRRVIRAPRQRVFDAWTQPDEVKKWHCPGPTIVPNAEIDLRVGGAWRIEMQRPDGTKRVAFGTYREIVPPSRLVYTWSWDVQPMDSLVTVEFRDVDGGTEVMVRHVLPTELDRDQHEQGWLGGLAKLEAMF